MVHKILHRKLQIKQLEKPIKNRMWTGVRCSDSVCSSCCTSAIRSVTVKWLEHNLIWSIFPLETKLFKLFSLEKIFYYKIRASGWHTTDSNMIGINIYITIFSIYNGHNSFQTSNQLKLLMLSNLYHWPVYSSTSRYKGEICTSTCFISHN
jgi:hypothetical protein